MELRKTLAIGMGAIVLCILIYGSISFFAQKEVGVGEVHYCEIKKFDNEQQLRESQFGPNISIKGVSKVEKPYNQSFEREFLVSRSNCFKSVSNYSRAGNITALIKFTNPGNYLEDQTFYRNEKNEIVLINSGTAQ